MLSPAQGARVLEVLGDCPADSTRAYCLEHLTVAVNIPPLHAATLVPLIQTLRATGDCAAQYGGFCDVEAHDTDDLLVWRPDRPAARGLQSA